MALFGIGDVVADRFVVEQVLPGGGMGHVYRAYDRETGQQVALKVAHTELRRFGREVRLLAALTHPRIVRYVAHGTTTEGLPWVAMEWIAGETLSQFLARRALTIDECIAIGRSVAEALRAAHGRGIVHRDVKPANIMIEGGAIETLRLIDFGVARIEDEPTISTSSAGTLVGTPSYMAPEQARGEAEIGPAADVFALGCVMYRCLAGRAPFVGDGTVAILSKILFDEPPSLLQLRPDAPPALAELVTSMLAKQSSARPESGAELVARIEALSSARRTAPPPEDSKRSLGGDELRVAAVVIVGISKEPDLVQSVFARELGALGRIERLRDGSTVVLVRGRGTAVDEAAGAAAAAAALRAADVDVPMAIATGRASLAGDRPPVGEVLDRAAAMFRSASAGQTLLDPTTASLLDESFAVEVTRGAALLVGRTEGDGGRRLLGRVTPFVGRDDELAAIESVVNRCIDDRLPKAVLVVGPAGSGKSRLRHELVARIGDRADVWIARADPMGKQTALGLATQILRALVGAHEGETQAERREKLRERVARTVPARDVSRVATFLGEAIGMPATPADGLVAATRDPVLLGDQIRRAWMDLVDGETQAHPVVVVLEDLQWADRATVALFEGALSLFVDRPFALVGFARPELDEAFPSLWRDRDMQSVRLGPLPKRAAEQLVRTMMGPRGDALATRLGDLCGGNLFYLEELIRAAAEGRETLPTSVLAMAQSRIEALEADDRRILRAASIFGRAFWEQGVALLLGSTAATDLHRRIDRLVSLELLVRRRESTFAGTAEVSFRHTLLREGAYAMLTEDDRALGHRLAGQWLESAGSTDAAAVAEHFAVGRHDERAAAWFVRAARDALEANDLVGATQLAARARECCRGEGAHLGTICATEAVAFRWQGRLQEALDSGTEAVRVVEPGSQDWCDAQMARGTALLAMGRPVELEELYAEARSWLESPSAPARVLDVTAHLGRCLLQAGRSELAEAAFRSVERSDAEDLGIRGRIEYSRILQLMYAARTTGALEVSARVIDLLERGGDIRNACTARINAGYMFASLGRYEDAERLLRESLDAARRLGLVTQATGASENLGWVMARLGRVEEGLKLERQTVAASVASGDRRFEGGARTYLSSMLLSAGDVAGSEREARAAVDVLAAVPPMLACALGALAEVLLTTHRDREALEVAVRAYEMASSSSEEEGPILLVRAEALRANARTEEALVAIREARARLLGRAEGIDRVEWRQCFLERIPEHARTLRLAAEWLGEA